MAYTIPKTEPAWVRLGDTWSWYRSDLAEFPAPTWSLTYHFKNAVGGFDVAATADGTGFAVNVDPATTAALTAGRYDYVALVTDGTDRHEVGSGVLEVRPDFAAVGALDARTLPRKILDAIDAILESRATLDQIDLVNAATGDQSFARNPSLLLSYRSKVEQDVKRLEGTGGMQQIGVRFRSVAI